MNYLQQIKILIKEKGLSQEELAHLLGISKNTLNNYLNGKTKMDVETMLKILNILEMPAANFFGQLVYQNVANNQVLGSVGDVNLTAETGADIDKIREELSEAMDKIKVLEDKIKVLENEREQLNQSLQKAKEQSATVEGELKAAQASIKEKDEIISILKDKLDKAENLVDKLIDRK